MKPNEHKFRYISTKCSLSVLVLQDMKAILLGFPLVATSGSEILIPLNQSRIPMSGTLRERCLSVQDQRSEAALSEKRQRLMILKLTFISSFTHLLLSIKRTFNRAACWVRLQHRYAVCSTVLAGQSRQRMVPALWVLMTCTIYSVHCRMYIVKYTL